MDKLGLNLLAEALSHVGLNKITVLLSIRQPNQEVVYVMVEFNGDGNLLTSHMSQHGN